VIGPCTDAADGRRGDDAPMPANVSLEVVAIEKPDGLNVVLGQAHFI